MRSSACTPNPPHLLNPLHTTRTEPRPTHSLRLILQRLRYRCSSSLAHKMISTHGVCLPRCSLILVRRPTTRSSTNLNLNLHPSPSLAETQSIIRIGGMETSKGLAAESMARSFKNCSTVKFTTGKEVGGGMAEATTLFFSGYPWILKHVTLVCPKRLQ